LLLHIASHYVCVFGLYAPLQKKFGCAAGENDNSLQTGTAGTGQHLARFGFSDMGDGARVDYDDIGWRAKRDLPEAQFLKLPCQLPTVILVHFAP
jgi:hypothetical protein